MGAEFAPDRVWGTIFIVLYGLMLAVAMLVVFGIAAAFSFAGNHEMGSGGFAPKLFGAAFATIASVIILVSLGSHVVAAVGIHKSRAWGFWATIILSIISLASSGGGTCLTIIPLVYSIVRLSGSYGPKPV
jgi:hypothetical protein